MEDLISRVLDIEHEAQAVIGEAQKIKQSYAENMQAQAAARREELFVKMNEKIKQIEQTEEQYINRRIAEISENENKVQARLEKQFELRGEKWENELLTQLFDLGDSE